MSTTLLFVTEAMKTSPSLTLIYFQGLKALLQLSPYLRFSIADAFFHE